MYVDSLGGASPLAEAARLVYTSTRFCTMPIGMPHWLRFSCVHTEGGAEGKIGSEAERGREGGKEREPLNHQ
jgi:hypothetical protein